MTSLPPTSSTPSTPPLLFSIPEELNCLIADYINLEKFSLVNSTALRIGRDKVLWLHNFQQITHDNMDLVPIICSLDPSIEKDQNPFRVFLKKLWQVEQKHFSFLKDLSFQLHQKPNNSFSSSTHLALSCDLFRLISADTRPPCFHVEPIPLLFKNTSTYDLKNLFAVFFLTDSIFQDIWPTCQTTSFSHLLRRYLLHPSYDPNIYIKRLTALLTLSNTPKAPLLPVNKKNLQENLIEIHSTIIDQMPSPTEDWRSLIFSIIGNRPAVFSQRLLGASTLAEEIPTAFITAILFQQQIMVSLILEVHLNLIAEKLFLQGLEISSKMGATPLFTFLWELPLFEHHRSLHLQSCFLLQLEKKNTDFIYRYINDPAIAPIVSKAFVMTAEMGFLEMVKILEDRVDPSDFDLAFQGACEACAENTIRYLSDKNMISVDDFEKGILRLARHQKYPLIRDLLSSCKISYKLKEQLFRSSILSHEQSFALWIHSLFSPSTHLISKALLTSIQENLQELFTHLIHQKKYDNLLDIPLIMAVKYKRISMVRELMETILCHLENPRADLQYSPPPSPRKAFQGNEPFQLFFYHQTPLHIEEKLLEEVKEILSFCEESRKSPLQILLSSFSNEGFANLIFAPDSPRDLKRLSICYHIALQIARERNDSEMLKILKTSKTLP